MKAIVCTKYGPPDVLQIQEVETPTPKDNEILVKVHSTTVTAADVRIRSFSVPAIFWLPTKLALGFRKPKMDILGVEFAGIIESIGKDVQKFKKGDRVFGATPLDRFGCYAEYVCLSDKGIVTHIPDELSYEDVASVPFMGIAALYFLKKANISKGQKVLIYGASGAVGTYAIQIAKYFGTEVTAVCSTSNLDLVKSIGADKVIDYKKEDFTKNGEIYDVIFDTVGKTSFYPSLESLKNNGSYLLSNPPISHEFYRAFHCLFNDLIFGYYSLKIVAGTAKDSVEDLEFLKSLLESGKLKSVIDKTYFYKDIVEAHRYVDQGHKKGNVIVNFD